MTGKPAPDPDQGMPVPLAISRISRRRLLGARALAMTCLGRACPSADRMLKPWALNFSRANGSQSVTETSSMSLPEELDGSYRPNILELVENLAVQTGRQTVLLHDGHVSHSRADIRNDALDVDALCLAHYPLPLSQYAV